MGLTRKHWIYGALTFVSLLAAILKVTYFDDPDRQWMAFFSALLYISFVVWAVSELRAIHAREREEQEPLPPGAAAFFQSLENRPDDDALISAETYLSLGESLETICRYVEPRYGDWSPSERQAYRHGLRAALDERRSQLPPAGAAE